MSSSSQLLTSSGRASLTSSGRRACCGSIAPMGYRERREFHVSEGASKGTVYMDCDKCGKCIVSFPTTDTYIEKPKTPPPPQTPTSPTTGDVASTDATNDGDSSTERVESLLSDDEESTIPLHIRPHIILRLRNGDNDGHGHRNKKFSTTRKTIKKKKALVPSPYGDGTFRYVTVKKTIKKTKIPKVFKSQRRLDFSHI